MLARRRFFPNKNLFNTATILLTQRFTYSRFQFLDTDKLFGRV
ncbi:hypothetical protein AVDCRST_MAG92-439 [uncultured Coleofasciculus sp.]|uniref:Uncharacterized protein n=1 Tax=uncultured Coleofasciculus sp. TaxID=1267456 RepID=A0A6J4HAZ0_9CYAN|nr:hypothetical protein AVDCRST_MAG92-439 [uncultured Coleofasciculus sp.]